MTRLSAAAHASPLDGRRVGSVVLAAALAAALGCGAGWTPGPATTSVRFAGPCAVGGEAQVEACGECASLDGASSASRRTPAARSGSSSGGGGSSSSG